MSNKFLLSQRRCLNFAVLCTQSALLRAEPVFCVLLPSAFCCFACFRFSLALACCCTPDTRVARCSCHRCSLFKMLDKVLLVFVLANSVLGFPGTSSLPPILPFALAGEPCCVSGPFADPTALRSLCNQSSYRRIRRSNYQSQLYRRHSFSSDPYRKTRCLYLSKYPVYIRRCSLSSRNLYQPSKTRLRSLFDLVH